MLLAMNRRLRRAEGFLAVAFAAALVIGPDLAEAQDAQGTPPAAPAAPQAPTPPPAAPASEATPAPPGAEAPPAAPVAPAAPAGQAQQQADRFSPEELRNLLKPIALYPDALLAQMLPAAAYPLEIVQAERWLEKNPNLVAANDFSGIDSQKWDPAVKAMARFPDVLRSSSTDTRQGVRLAPFPVSTRPPESAALGYARRTTLLFVTWGFQRADPAIPA
jgi:hypothetical protein